MPDDRSCVSSQVIGPGFELVELFDHVERDDDLVLLEHEQRVGIVQQNVGVENEMLDVAVVAHFPSMVQQLSVASRCIINSQRLTDNGCRCSIHSNSCRDFWRKCGAGESSSHYWENTFRQANRSAKAGSCTIFRQVPLKAK